MVNLPPDPLPYGSVMHPVRQDPTQWITEVHWGGAVYFDGFTTVYNIDPLAARPPLAPLPPVPVDVAAITISVWLDDKSGQAPYIYTEPQVVAYQEVIPGDHTAHISQSDRRFLLAASDELHVANYAGKSVAEIEAGTYEAADGQPVLAFDYDTVAQTWYNLLISLDNASSTVSMAINDTFVPYDYSPLPVPPGWLIPLTNAQPGTAIFPPDLGVSPTQLYRAIGGGNPVNPMGRFGAQYIGGMAKLVIYPGAAMDFSDPAIRRQFNEADPVTGIFKPASTPLPPGYALLCDGGKTAFPVNQATGQQLLVAGALQNYPGAFPS